MLLVAPVTSIVVDICFMFNLLTKLYELLTTQWRKIAVVFVLSCCVFTQVAIIAKYLSTMITAVDLTAMSCGEGSFTILAQFFSGDEKHRGGALKRAS